MKKLLIAIILVFAVIIFIQFCTEKGGESEEGIGYGCTSETEGQTYAHFRDAVRRYKFERSDLAEAWSRGNVETSLAVTPPEGLRDSRAIWFSMDSLKKFICTIEKYSKEIGIPSDSLGIRIYYGIYSDTDYFSRMHTVFMVPTFTMGTGSQVDFDPRFSSIEMNRHMDSITKKIITRLLHTDFISLKDRPAFKSLIYGRSSSSVIKKNVIGGNSMIQNNGHLCPSLCPNPNTLDDIDHNP